MRKLYFIIALVLIAHCDLRAQWVRDTIISPMRGLYSMVTLEDTLYVSSGTILHSTDEGNTWQNWDNGLFRGYAYWPFVGDGHFFLATVAGFGPPEDTNYGKLFRSTDAGARWLQVNVRKFSLGANALTMIGNTLYTPGDAGLFRSTDSGATWSIATDSANSGLLAGSHVNCFLQWNGITFAGSDTGIFITTDSGQTWHTVPSMDTLREIRSLVSLDPYIYAAMEDSIFRSSDSGRSWLYISESYFGYLPNFSFGVADGNLLFCTGYFPVIYRSSNSGSTWDFFGQSFDTLGGTYGLFYSSRKYVYFACMGEYLFRRPLSDFDKSGVAEQPSVTSSNDLRVFPNPARDALQVLGGPSGTARLFDLLGRERAEARDDGSGATLDISHLEAGAYFLRMGNQSAKVEITH